ncbi:NACHT domain-containing protein [Asanoa siamensis]|uniref:NACHT domain-containing protein n=1 Tax=Asanoa siamensis TaxID=926357 RepID=A0ABQ4D195_9ACTN|nr:hypothetical protein [Asanoa siamensis]GIF77315.1 hypothetical protein Asi02nite_68330 [Asanoa siamensis]
MRPALRVAQVTLTVVGGTLVVPTAVNIGTGGEPPRWLEPYTGWLWPVAVGCVIAVIVVEAVERLRPAAREKAVRHRVGDPRNIPLALAQVDRYVSTRQRGSLAGRIALALDERPATVRQPAHLVARVTGDAFTLSPDLGIGDVFDRMDESMLILGAPGAGKTTQLLDLAAALVARARDAAEPLVPVLLDLSDWTRPRPTLWARLRREGDPPFDRWILQAMWERYRITEEVGAAWLRDDRVVLLLDGLDEVAEADRARCVREINALGVTRLAVCCRESDYAQVGARLRLQGAVGIRPLTRGQVAAFLAAVEPALGAVLSRLDSDDDLWDVLTSPLMLAITVLAHATGASVAAGDATRLRRQLFDAYVVEVLSRRRAAAGDDPERVLWMLRTLAQAATQRRFGVKVPPLSQVWFENLPARVNHVAFLWLVPVGRAAALAAVSAAMVARASVAAALLPFALGLALVPERSMRPPPAPRVRRLAAAAYVSLAVVLGAGLAFGLAGAVALLGAWGALVVAVFGAVTLVVLVAVFASGEAPVWARVRDAAVTAGVGAGCLVWPVVGYSPDLGTGFVLGLLSAVAAVTFAYHELRLGPIRSDPAVPLPVVQMAVFTLVTAAAAGLVGGSLLTPVWAPALGWVVGLLVGLIPGLVFAVTVTPVLLRAGLAMAGEPDPWRRSFLRFAADRGLLVDAGGGEFRFVHLLVRDHLADCDPARLAAGVAHRRAALASAPVS